MTKKYDEDNTDWKIELRSSITKDDPEFLFNYGVDTTNVIPLSFKHVLAVDKNKFFWSAGDSTNRIHVVLCIRHSDLNLGTDTIRWNSFRTKYADGTYGYFTYHARSLFRLRRSMHESDDSPDKDYLNFIEHRAGIHVEFQPADPIFWQTGQNHYQCDVVVHDYLNYFYHHFPEDRKQVYLRRPGVKTNTEWEQFAKPPNYLGYWIIWHRSRLEDMGSDDSWNPPTTAKDADNKWMGVAEEHWIAADTVLCGMPGKGDGVDMEGNKDCGKGAGLTWKNSNYPRRTSFSIPLFFGPGTLSITDGDSAVNIYGENKKSNQSLPRIGVGVDGNKVWLYNETIKINVKSILKKEVKDWSVQGGLIIEHPYEQGKFYGGKPPGATYVTYDIEQIDINPEWLNTSPTTKCAIVFVMVDSEKRVISGAHFFEYYTKHTIIEHFSPTLIQVSDSKTVHQGDKESAFTFDSTYPYIIDPEKSNSLTFKQLEIKVQMPPPDHHYQMGALIYRIVDKDKGGYKVDPDYNFPFEYWLGIRTGTSKNQSRIDSTVLQTSSDTGTSNTNVAPPDKRQGSPDSNSQFDAKTFNYLVVSNDVPATFRPPDEGSYIQCYMLDVERRKKTWSDTRIPLPTAVGETTQRDIIFLLGDIHDGAEFQLFVQQYDSAHRPVGSPRRIGPSHFGKRTYDIKSVTIETVGVDDNQTFNFSNLKMPNAPPTDSFYYSFECWVDDESWGRKDLLPKSKPGEWSGSVVYEKKTLPKSAKCDFIFTVYADEDRHQQLASYNQLYLTEHFIKSFAVEDIYSGEDKYAGDGTKVKVQFRFEARTTLPKDDINYKCRIELHKFTDPDDGKDTPLIEHWDFSKIDGDFIKTVKAKDIDRDPGTYVFFIQLIENETGKNREKFYTLWETPRRMASGQIISDGGAVELSSPTTKPNETVIEYRILRDGLLGVVESPWEMRTESLIGGTAVTQPAWVVRPRTVSFRLLVTAPVDLMPDALYTLFKVLTAVPKKGMTIKLQSSNELYLLSLNGYIQVGSPKIESRDDTWAIISVVLDCPNYAWQGRRLLHPVDPNGEATTRIRPKGHYPPDVSIWIKWDDPSGATLRVNNNLQTLKINGVASGVQYVRVRHNSITQEYSVAAAASFPQYDDTTNGRSTILRSHSPHSIRSMILGDEKYRTTEQEEMFELIEPGSYLPIILDPWITNTITVTGGKIFALEYTPYYAFWW